MDKREREKVLEERNQKSKAFKDAQEKQIERDQTIMPVDELPLGEIKLEEEEEKNKKATKNRSTSER
ncbi:hypothetical protein [Bacillus sp. FJAT-45037]|uniref:hypothetical protein n=1 Tax=Bacillus sp. FJAT-45037 TaxID=2011007 RepID=UPI000C246092|nr:hypothetical protein [Bacillus sp. FJAT-45037]